MSVMRTAPESVMNPTTLLGFARDESPPEMVMFALDVPAGAPKPSVELLTKAPGKMVSTSPTVEPAVSVDDPPKSRVENNKPMSFDAIVGIASPFIWKPFGLTNTKLLTTAAPPMTEIVPAKSDRPPPVTLFKTILDDPLVYSRFSSADKPRPLPQRTTALLAPPKLTVPVADPGEPLYEYPSRAPDPEVPLRTVTPVEGN